MKADRQGPGEETLDQFAGPSSEREKEVRLGQEKRGERQQVTGPLSERERVTSLSVARRARKTVDRQVVRPREERERERER